MYENDKANLFFFIICMPFIIQETRCEKFDKQVF